MSHTSHFIKEGIRKYILENATDEFDLLRQLREETATLPQGQMQIAPEQGQFMAWIVASMSCKLALELGTFTGYSAMVMASCLAEGGRLITCDVDTKTSAIAQKYWQRAGLETSIELRIAPALESLSSLLDEGYAGKFDLVFIDADKRNYLSYYQKSLELLRAGGVMIIDNVFLAGRVLNPTENSPSSMLMHAFNQYLAKDERVTIAMIPIGDGVTLVRKK